MAEKGGPTLSYADRHELSSDEIDSIKEKLRPMLNTMQDLCQENA